MDVQWVKIVACFIKEWSRVINLIDERRIWEQIEVDQRRIREQTERIKRILWIAQRIRC